MGFLVLDADVTGLKRAVMSIWFRIPSDARDAARAIAVEDPLSRVLHGVIPLITWGPQQIGHTFLLDQIYQGAVDVSGFPVTLQSLETGPDFFLNPSYIGVYVGSDLNPKDPPVLEVFLQTQDIASGSGMYFIRTSWTGTPAGYNYINPGSPFHGAPVYFDIEYKSTDVTDSYLNALPDYFQHIGITSLPFEKWHHLLISWDLSGRQMSYVLDDQPQNDVDFPLMSSWEDTADPERGESARLTVTTLPTKPVSVPAHGSVNYTTPEGDSSSKTGVQHVELAELQIFADVTLDTAVESNRRAFIDYKHDQDGNPIGSDLKPVDPKKAEELLGQRPQILLHGSSKWIDGNNSGSLGMDDDGNKIDSGQFTPTGDIKSYTPDPSITVP